LSKLPNVLCETGAPDRNTLAARKLLRTLLRRVRNPPQLEKETMTPITLKEVIDCMGATLRNDQLQPTSDPVLTLSLKAPDGQIYLLPLSERGARRLWEAISYWKQREIPANGPSTAV
jgi:hypothetical protein